MPQDNEETRKAAVAMLRLGLATQSEAAHLAGVSRQLVAYWAEGAGVDPLQTRTAWLAREWRRRTGGQ